jgi:non-heme chloroperoxidase
MGTGEITRYIGKYGTERLKKAVLSKHRTILREFLKNFYSIGGEDGKRVSEYVMNANWTVAIGASPIGTVACVDAWIGDFRTDIPRNDIPTLIIHGDDDRILPADATSRRQAKMIKNVKFIELKDGSRGLTRPRQSRGLLPPFTPPVRSGRPYGA